jgi:hypothetical protein
MMNIRVRTLAVLAEFEHTGAVHLEEEVMVCW